jgi:hypothetical protein
MLEKITNKLFAEVIAYSFRRRPSTNSEQKIKASILKLIMDCVSVSNRAKRQRWASIHKNSNHYLASRYHNPQISYRIHVERVYNSLRDLGYLTEVKAGLFTEKDRYLTRYEATQKLVGLFDPDTRTAIPLSSVVVENPELIRVRIKVDGQRQLVDYPETEETKRMRDNVALINHALNQNWFDLELTDDEFEHLEQRIHRRVVESKEGEGRLLLQQRQIYRVFNNLEFNEGGRFYGGWWQTIPSEYRSKILIDGKRTEELDFGTLHPTILYSWAGVPIERDAYNIRLEPKRMPEGSSRADFRKVIKRAFNAMLNAKHRLNQPPRDIHLTEWGIKWKELVEAILEFHQPIADQFFTGVGLRLQFEDSQLAEELMIDFVTTRGMVPVLPVHDSFICHQGYIKEFNSIMKKRFEGRYGVPIEVKLSSGKSPTNQILNQHTLSELLSFDDKSYEQRLEIFRTKE